MRIGFFKMFTVAGVVSAWFMKASADGKIDAREAAELVEELCQILGVKASVEVPSE